MAADTLPLFQVPSLYVKDSRHKVRYPEKKGPGYKVWGTPYREKRNLTQNRQLRPGQSDAGCAKGPMPGSCTGCGPPARFVGLVGYVGYGL